MLHNSYHMQRRHFLPIVIVILAGLISPIFPMSLINEPTMLRESSEMNWNAIEKDPRYVSMRPDRVSASVQTKVDILESGGYRYTYSVRNLGEMPIAGIGLERLTPFTNRSSSLEGLQKDDGFWWLYAQTVNPKIRNYPVSVGSRNGTVTAVEYGLLPGESVVLQLDSLSPPGPIKLNVRGTGWVVDVQKNEMRDSPTNWVRSGVVLGPTTTILTLNRVAFLNYILLQEEVGRSLGWLSSDHDRRFGEMTTRLKKSVNEPTHVQVVKDAIRDLGAKDDELAIFFCMNLRLYLNRFYPGDGLTK